MRSSFVSDGVRLAAFILLVVAKTSGIDDDQICNEISLGAVIGEGGSAKVYIAEYQDRVPRDRDMLPNLRFAVKVFKKDQLVKQEYLMLKALDDVFKHAVQDHLEPRRFSELLGLCQHVRPSPFIVTDYIPHSFVSEDNSIHTDMEHILGLALAVEQIHRFGFVHLDIKPENIRVSKDNVVKLIDFGISQYLFDNRGPRDVTDLGTPDHMAPEVMRSARSLTGDDKEKVDIWGIGIVAFTTLTRRRYLHNEGCMAKLENCVGETFDRTQSKEWLASYIKTIYRLTNEVLEDPASPAMPEHEEFMHPTARQESDLVGAKCAKRCGEERRPSFDLATVVRARVADVDQYKGHVDAIVDTMSRLVFRKLLRFFAADRASIAFLITEISRVRQFMQSLEQRGKVIES